MAAGGPSPTSHPTMFGSSILRGGRDLSYERGTPVSVPRRVDADAGLTTCAGEAVSHARGRLYNLAWWAFDRGTLF